MIARHIRTAVQLAAFLLAGGFAPAFGQQASLQLDGADAQLCHHNDTSWDLDKTGVVAGGTVTWTVTVTRGATSHDYLAADGYVRITNGGAAPATLGNVVVNLQRKSGRNWISASSDIADATNGDAATKALIVRGASSEGLSSFTENGASGPLEFTDGDSNSVFALVPQPALGPGQTLNLYFSARFDNTILGIPVGESVRIEFIVTFGNSGARGGSGASGSNIDINGNGVIDGDERYVRSVPSRITRPVPALEKCNDSVLLGDLEEDISATGTVTFGNFTTTIGEGLGLEVLSASAVRTVSVDVDGGEDGGSITNTARLLGESDFVTVNGHDFVCCVGVDLSASDTRVIDGDDDGLQPGDFTTFSQGGWGSRPNGNNPGTILALFFSTVYPGGVEVGIAGAGGFSMRFTSASAVESYLPAGGPSGSLTGDLLNPTSTSAGNFGAQVLALRLSVDFSAAGVTQGPGGPFGGLTLVGTGGSLDGLTVSQVLAAAETALGGGGLPAGYTYGAFNALVTDLNMSFDNGIPTAWALAHLSP